MKSPSILTILLKTSSWWMRDGGLGSVMETGAYFLPTMLKRYNQLHLVVTCDIPVSLQIQNLMCFWFHCNIIIVRAWKEFFSLFTFCLVTCYYPAVD